MSNNVYPDPDPPAGATVPSSVPLDAASLISGTISVGAAAAGVAAGGPALLTPVMATELSWTVPLLVRSMPMGYATVVIIFGALSVILGTLNLARGIRRKRELREKMKDFQNQLDSLCQQARIV